MVTQHTSKRTKRGSPIQMKQDLRLAPLPIPTHPPHCMKLPKCIKTYFIAETQMDLAQMTHLRGLLYTFLFNVICE